MATWCVILPQEFLALAERQGTTVAADDWPSPYGCFVAVDGRNRGRTSASRSGDCALRSHRASSAGDAIWPRHRGWLFCLIGRGHCGCLAILTLHSQTPIAALKDAREIGQAATLMFALNHCRRDPHSAAGTTRRQPYWPTSLSALADEKDAFILEGVWNAVARWGICFDWRSLGSRPA